MSESKEDIIINLRSVLLSSKGGIQLNNINDQYVEFFGNNLSVEDLGYYDLHEFLTSHPQDFVFYGDYVMAAIKSQSKHIADLVQNQKERKKKFNKTENIGNVLCYHCKQNVNVTGLKKERTRRVRRKRNRQSKLARRLKRENQKQRTTEPDKPKIMKIIETQRPTTYNPNGWQYAINVFRNFLIDAMKNKGEENDEIQDFTSDNITDTDSGYISFEY